MIYLKTLRKQCKITQQKMAEYLSLTQQAYATYENGTAQPSIDSLKKLADYFGVSVDYLLGRETQTNTLSQEHKQLIDYYEQCDEIDKVRILAYAEAVAENNKEVYKNVDKQQKPLKKVK